jgi:two-component system nitrogen regulation response regulator GlnG
MTTGRILIAEDDPSLRTVMVLALQSAGHEVVAVDDGAPAMRELRRGRFDVAIVDVRMKTLSGLDVLRQSAALDDAPLVIVITAQNTMANAIEAMKAGAFEYLCKPFDLDAFERLVIRAVKDRGARSAPPQPRHDGAGRTLYGRSPAMQRVFKALGRAAGSPHAVLVTGESGTGKELVARILHQEGPRADGPFVAVNAAAIPSDLLEADLFGHARGAFTGAHAEQRGKFRMADGGTLFLDEIGEMPLSLQAKLLRVLEEKAFYPVGAQSQVSVDVRIVAATNRVIPELVREGRFRGDLYYRLNVLGIHLPPLRERLEDIPQLAEWLLEKHVRETGDVPRSLSADAQRLLASATWAGNVRELENVLVRAATFAQGAVIRADDLELERVDGVLQGGLQEQLRESIEPVVRTWNPHEAGRSGLYDHIVGSAERAAIEAAMARVGGNQVQAAKLLGINRNTLKRKLDEHGLDAAQWRTS